jgi:hypothetical protein
MHIGYAASIESFFLAVMMPLVFQKIKEGHR